MSNRMRFGRLLYEAHGDETEPWVRRTETMQEAYCDVAERFIVAAGLVPLTDDQWDDLLDALTTEPLWIQIDQAWTCSRCGTTFEKPERSYVTGRWTVERTSAIYDLRIKDPLCRACVFEGQPVDPDVQALADHIVAIVDERTERGGKGE